MIIAGLQSSNMLQTNTSNYYRQGYQQPSNSCHATRPAFADFEERIPLMTLEITLIPCVTLEIYLFLYDIGFKISCLP
jgi:hypothetical protein